MGILKAILIIGFYQTLILGGLVLARKKKYLSDYFLAVMFLVYGITLLMGYLEIYNRENDYPFPGLINTSSPLIFLHGPALWFYIKTLTSQHFRFKVKYLLHFLPFIFVVTLFSVGLYSLPASQRVTMESTEAFKNGIIFPMVIILIAVFTQGYFIWGILLIKKYKSQIQNYFSKIETIDLAWLRILLITSVFFYLGNSLLYLADYIFHFFSYNQLQSIGYALASVFILVLGFRGYRQGNIFSSHPVVIDLEKSEMAGKSNVLYDAKDKKFINQLIDFMQTHKPHTSPELTLAGLATQLRVNPDYLSNILNGMMNKNFFDFVNSYRIEEFKKICIAQKASNPTIMGMAWDAGFNSKATFNRVFKKNTGITPGEYVNSIQ